MSETQHERISRYFRNVITANEVEILSPMINQELSDLFMEGDVDCSGCTHRIAQSFMLIGETKFTIVSNQWYLTFIQNDLYWLLLQSKQFISTK